MSTLLDTVHNAMGGPVAEGDRVYRSGVASEVRWLRPSQVNALWWLSGSVPVTRFLEAPYVRFQTWLFGSVTWVTPKVAGS
jgi:hypothetical protein